MVKAGLKVVMYEHRLAPVVCIWGGAMFFNQIIVKNALLFINEQGIKQSEFRNDNMSLKTPAFI